MGVCVVGGQGLRVVVVVVIVVLGLTLWFLLLVELALVLLVLGDTRLKVGLVVVGCDESKILKTRFGATGTVVCRKRKTEKHVAAGEGQSRRTGAQAWRQRGRTVWDL